MSYGRRTRKAWKARHATLQVTEEGEYLCGDCRVSFQCGRCYEPLTSANFQAHRHGLDTVELFHPEAGT